MELHYTYSPIEKAIESLRVYERAYLPDTGRRRITCHEK
jgi:hypothetical protein